MLSRLPSLLIIFAALLIACRVPAPAQADALEAINPAARAVSMAANLPAYDVVAIRQNKSGTENSSLDTTHDGVVIENASFAEILEFAYDIASFDLISGISGPVASTRFDIRARIDGRDGDRPAKLKDEQLQAMLIPLLAERFHLKFHVVAKRMTVYEVVVARGGPKFKLTGPTANPGSVNYSFSGNDSILIFKKSSMSTLAGVLSDSGLQHLIVDRTGLTGNGDFTLKWSSDDAQEQGGRDLVTIFAAMQDQLGLKLQPAKRLVDNLVIDHAEMPSEN